MNRERFILFFLLMGAITFLSMLNPDAYTLSFMAFGNIYTLPAIMAVLVSGTAIILYGFSVWWGNWALKLVYDARELWDNRDKE